MELTAAIAIALLIATVKKVTDFPAQIAQGDRNAIIKQTIAWVVGIAGAFLLRATDFGSGITVIAAHDSVAALTLASVNPWTVVVFGFSIGSGASVALNDLPSAVDRYRTSSVGPIIDGPNAALKAVQAVPLPPLNPQTPVALIADVGNPEVPVQ